MRWKRVPWQEKQESATTKKTQVYVRQSPNYITTICTLSAKQYCKAVIFEAVAAR